MCGRYLSPDAAAFERHFKLTPPEGYRRSFNVAPSQFAAVIRQREGHRVAELGVWGFQPAWAKRAWINARAETVFTSAAFRHAARASRCLVPAAGWYEWQGARAPKQPYVLYQDGFEPFAFAGIVTTADRNGERQTTFAILTRAAATAIAGIHDRMPAVLSPADYAMWLDEAADRETLERLLSAAPPDIATKPVSTFVNKPANNDEKCIEEWVDGVPSSNVRP